MDSQSIEIAGRKVTKADWDATPESVKLAIEDFHGMIGVLTQKVSNLEEKLNKNSKNSSIPPSKNGFGGGKKVERKEVKRAPKQRIKQETSEQKLYPVEECQEIHEEKPQACTQCGEKLQGEDPEPYRHQIIEMPIVRPDVVEYRLHELECEHCGTKTRAELPAGVTPKSYGQGLAAWIAILSSEYRQSYRQVERLLAELCGVELSRGTIGRARSEINAAVESATISAQEYVQQQPVVNVDETGFKQYNGDGQNPGKKRGWLWVVVTPLVSFFTVALSRSQATAQAILGNYTGLVGSDRCPSYGWLENDHRQVCWAHLLRDFQAMAERSGASCEIGTSLLHKGYRLFHWWHRVRDGTMSRELFIEATNLLRAAVKAELESAINLPIGRTETTPLAKTVRTCEQLLKIEPALWTFVDHQDLEPTNNVAERALRPAVIWRMQSRRGFLGVRCTKQRNTSFGSQSQGGSEFVSRMLTVSSSLKAQSRSVLDFLTQSCQASRLGTTPPTLIPMSEPTLSNERIILL